MDGPVGIANPPSTWTLESAYEYATARAQPPKDPDGEPLYNCPFPPCNKQFSKRFNLKAHLRVHTGDKPFVCNFSGCKRRFMWKSSLTSHQTGHSRRKAELEKRAADHPLQEQLMLQHQQQRLNWQQQQQQQYANSFLPQPHSTIHPSNSYFQQQQQQQSSQIPYSRPFSSKRSHTDTQSQHPHAFLSIQEQHRQFQTQQHQPTSHPLPHTHPHFPSPHQASSSYHYTQPQQPIQTSQPIQQVPSSSTFPTSDRFISQPLDHNNQPFTSSNPPTYTQHHQSQIPQSSQQPQPLTHPIQHPYDDQRQQDQNKRQQDEITAVNNLRFEQQLHDDDERRNQRELILREQQEQLRREQLQLKERQRQLDHEQQQHEEEQRQAKRLKEEERHGIDDRPQQLDNSTNLQQTDLQQQRRSVQSTHQPSQPHPIVSVSQPSHVTASRPPLQPSSNLPNQVQSNSNNVQNGTSIYPNQPLATNTTQSTNPSDIVMQNTTNGSDTAISPPPPPCNKLPPISESIEFRDSGLKQTQKRLASAMDDDKPTESSRTNDDNRRDAMEDVDAKTPTLPSPSAITSTLGDPLASNKRGLYGTLSKNSPSVIPTTSLLPSPSASLGMPRSPNAFSRQFLFPSHISSPSWVSTPTMPAGSSSMAIPGISPKTGQTPPASIDIQMKSLGNDKYNGDISPLPQDIPISPGVTSPAPVPILPEVTLGNRPRRPGNRSSKPPLSGPSLSTRSNLLPPLTNVPRAAPAQPPTHIDLGGLAIDELNCNHSLAALGSPHTELSPLPVASPIIGTAQTPTSPMESYSPFSINNTSARVKPTMTW